MVLHKIKNLIPKSLLGKYHKMLAVFANVYYGRPSEKLKVIGVTGTNGKSTSAILIAKILEEAGNKVGVTSTAIFKIADKEWLNDEKMTMLGRFKLQKMLKQMVDAGCQYAVIETSSQGIEQYRHLGINYDIAVFTNLTPEHIEAHKGFENYKKAKLKLFKHLENLGKDKTIIANGDDKYVDEFLNFDVENKIFFGLDTQITRSACFAVERTGSESALGGKSPESCGFITRSRTLKPKFQFRDDKKRQIIDMVTASELSFKPEGISFNVNDIELNTNLYGQFNVYNCLAGIAVGQVYGVDTKTAKPALEKIKNIPGRMEFVEVGQNFKVLIDYAPEPEGVKQLYKTIRDHKIAKGKIIHVLGSCGGGRDVARRPVLGKLASKNSDIVIVTNEDPYDDDPQEIIDQVAEGASQAGKILNKNLYKIIDRRLAVEKALSLAGENDLVILTGKGCEQFICVAGGKKIPYDERKVVGDILRKK